VTNITTTPENPCKHPNVKTSLSVCLTLKLAGLAEADLWISVPCEFADER
jgi:hypothetical protein